MSSPAEPEGAGEQAQQPLSAEEARKLVEELRVAPAEEVVTEALFSLLNAAHVKLGRRDARLMIDLSAVMLEHLRGYLSEELVKRVDRALAQLRLGQVTAEKEAARSPQSEPNDLDTVPTIPASGAAPAPASAPGAAPSPASSQSSGLWVPGQ